MIRRTVLCGRKEKGGNCNESITKASKFLSDYTSVVVIAIAVVTFFVPAMMGWVNNPLFVDPVSNKFTCQSIIIGIIMFSMGLTLTTEDFKILAQRPFDICIGAIAQYLIMPFLAFALTKVLQLPDGIALGLILVGCCPGGVSSNIMSYLCGGDVAFSVGMTTVSTIISPVMTPLMVSLLASGTHITIKGLPMFVSIVETVIVPVAFGFLLNYLFGKKKTFTELQKVMPGVAVLGLACVVGGVVSSQGDKFFESGVVIFVAVFLHNGLGYLLGYGAGRLTGMICKEENDLHRSWNAERRTCYQPCNYNGTVCGGTGICNYLCCILYMAFYLRNTSRRIICSI